MKRFSFFILLLLMSCFKDAPHDNPLESPQGFKIEGTVQTVYQPRQPLAQVPILLKENNLITFTNASGRFQFKYLKPDSYTVVYGGGAFNKDSLKILVNQNRNLTLFVDRLPLIEKIQLTTHHQARWFPVEDNYFLQIRILASDPDGVADLDKAYCQIPAMGVFDSLTPGAQIGTYQTVRTPQDYGLQSLHELIGKAFYLMVEDDQGFMTQSAATFLTRIIDQSVQLLAPTGLQTITSDTVQFRWQAVYLPFTFHYKIEVFQINSGVISIVKTLEPIEAQAHEFLWPHQLPSGEYLWRIYIVDEFGNTSSSKEGAFQIP